MEQIWKDLYQVAMQVLHPREVSPWVEAGGVAAAIEADSGRIYTGICVDSAARWVSAPSAMPFFRCSPKGRAASGGWLPSGGEARPCRPAEPAGS